MKKLIKNLLVILVMTFSFLTVTSSTFQTPAYADSSCREILGMKSWDCGLSPWEDGNISENVRQIILNVGEALSTVASYLALGFVIYGGYKYMASSGDPTKILHGKQILTRAIIGLAICMLSKVIFNFMILSMGSKQLSMEDSSQLLKNLFTWFTSIAGIFAVIYLIIGGVGYMTAAGDPTKLQKAKKTIIYAIVGLLIVGLSAIIINWVMGTVQKNGGEVTYLTSTIAVKE